MNQKAPTIEQEMAKFSGFTAENGKTVESGKENKVGSNRDISPEEEQAGSKLAPGAATKPNKSAEKPSPVAAAKVELTEDESAAALDKAREKLGEGEELTEDEETEILAEALNEKRAAVRPGKTESDRVRKAQEGRRRAEARAARAENELGDIRARLARIESGTPPLTDKDKGGNNEAAKEPDPKAFELGELDPKYIRALVRWENAQADAERAKNQDKTKRSSDEERARAEAKARVDAFEDVGRELYDDFEEVVVETRKLPESDPASWPCSATLGQLMLDNEDVGPHIAYVLASDPKEARRIAKLTPAKQMRWFFEQEAKFTSDEGEDKKAGKDEDKGDKSGRHPQNPSNGQRVVSRAPTPPSRRNNGSGGNQQVSAATQDFAAFEAMAREAQKPKR